MFSHEISAINETFSSCLSSAFHFLMAIYLVFVCSTYFTPDLINIFVLTIFLVLTPNILKPQDLNVDKRIIFALVLLLDAILQIDICRL